MSLKQNPISDTFDFETQLDQLVYELYGLVADEIRIVEVKYKSSKKDGKAQKHRK